MGRPIYKIELPWVFGVQKMSVIPVFNILVCDVHAWHGQTGGRAEGSQVEDEGEADVFVELLAAGHRLLEPLEVKG